MDQQNNSNYPGGDETTPSPDTGGTPPPPAFGDPDPPAYGDPMTPPPPDPLPPSPPPGLPPSPSSVPNPPNLGPANPTDATGSTGSLTNPGKEARNWAVLSHLSALAVGLLGSAVGLPIFSFIGPLTIYLMKKDESPFVADQAKEALNFNISIGIIMFVLIVLSLTIILMIITIPLMILIGLAAIILSIIGAVKASNGEAYRYPFTIRLIN